MMRQFPVWWKLHLLHLGSVLAYRLAGVGVIDFVAEGAATGCCLLASFWDKLRSFLFQNFRFLLIGLWSWVSLTTDTRWFPWSLPRFEFSTLFPFSFVSLALNCAMTTVMAAVPVSWNVAESICRIGASSVHQLFPCEDMILKHEGKQVRK